MRQTYDSVVPYITKDGSEIRELMHPAVHGNRNQSLAEATIMPGCKTQLHRHRHTEELYHITRGRGLMTLEGRHFEVQPGDTICIMPGEEHGIENRSDIPLVLLCCCSPAYSHDDTILSQPTD